METGRQRVKGHTSSSCDLELEGHAEPVAHSVDEIAELSACTCVGWKAVLAHFTE